MPLTAGARLGHYEIQGAIGSGGMGAVYKARDSRLNRTVAIKVLLDNLSDQPDARARFEREAQTIAGLNHPHICTLHDVGRDGETDFLVMEFLEGETLAQKLEHGPLPLNQALQYATQIADALDKAHRQGITHRDLKPGNIMITKNGVKLLDFGLAKLRQPQNASSLSMLPTNAEVTAPGTILGSLQYMAPEQLEGGEADARTDIFAFGAVLFEMVTGRKAFSGKSQVSLIGAILKDTPPPVSQLQRIAPPSLDRLIAACLEKDPDDRWQTARDLWRELSHAVKEKPAETVALPKDTRRARPLVLGLVVVLVAAALAGVAAWNLKPAAPSTALPIARLAVTLPPGDQIVSEASIALSPDGSNVAYLGLRAGIQQLYVRPIDSLEATPIAGTQSGAYPFFSPDGQWLGFFQQGKLKKVPVTGGATQILGDAANGRGAHWGVDDNIYFAPLSNSGIWKVPASGGASQEVTKVDRGKGEISHRFPQILTGGKALLFTVWTGLGADEKHLNLQILETGERRVLIQGGDTGRYVPTGHVVAFRSGTPLAIPFDMASLTVSSAPPVPLTELVRTGEGSVYALAESGTLAYVPGRPATNGSRLAWVDRTGKVEALPPLSAGINGLTMSPDGRRAAVNSEGGGIGIYDFTRATLTPLIPPSAGASQAPVWTHDGTRIVYRGTRTGFRNLYWKAVNGAGEEERLTTSENLQTPESVSLDGKWLAYYEIDPKTGEDIWVLPLEGERKPQAFLKTAFSELNPHFSPDGRWMAHTSNESGRFEIYAQPFPGPGARVQISTEGGTDPVWSRNGRELFYLNNDKMMAVNVTTEPSLTTLIAGAPRVLFQGRFARSLTAISSFDIAPDGQRFLMVPDTQSEQSATQINVVLNWFEELKRLVPAVSR